MASGLPKGASSAISKFVGLPFGAGALASLPFALKNFLPHKFSSETTDYLKYQGRKPQATRRNAGFKRGRGGLMKRAALRPVANTPMATSKPQPKPMNRTPGMGGRGRKSALAQALRRSWF